LSGLSYFSNMKIGWKYAIYGIRMMLKSEKNFRLHITLFLFLVGLSYYLGINKIEWILILVCSAFVFSLEMVNSCIEKLCNFITKDKHQEIGWIKDVAAGAVLVAALFSFIISILIFAPYFYLLLWS